MGLETWAVEGVVGCIAAVATEQEAAKVLGVKAPLFAPLVTPALGPSLCSAPQSPFPQSPFLIHPFARPHGSVGGLTTRGYNPNLENPALGQDFIDNEAVTREIAARYFELKNGVPATAPPPMTAPATISLPKPDATPTKPKPPPPEQQKSGFQGTQRAAETTAMGHNNNNNNNNNKQGNSSRGKARGGKFDLGAELMAAQGASGRLGFVAPCRQVCACQAVEHALVGNCRSCGKIICVQEGLGPCSFCGVEYTGKLGAKPPPPPLPPVAEAAVRAEEEEREHEGDAADEAGVDAATAKAIEAKDRLVHFDRTSMQRTTVIDDQSDYFAIDSNQVRPVAPRGAPWRGSLGGDVTVQRGRGGSHPPRAGRHLWLGPHTSHA